jgi:predicted Zn-dependent protease
MKFLHLLKGKTPEQIEIQGDVFFEKGEYGSSKIEYEKALSKLEKKDPQAIEKISKVKEKVVQSCNGLASEHERTAADLIENGYTEEAESLLTLALQLATDEQIISSSEKRLQTLGSQSTPSAEPDVHGSELLEKRKEVPDEQMVQDPGDHYFTLLVSTLPEEDQSEYHSYAESFKEGYVKLNQGDFEGAAFLFSKTLEESNSTGSFIALELGTTHLNLGQNEQALLLLEDFFKHHPETLRVYPLLCEIYWQNHEFGKAHALLQSCPETLKNHPVIHVLEGETFFQDNKYEEAEAHYSSFLNFCGWDEAIGRAQAKTLEALGKKEEAKEQYVKILNACQGCGKQTDPLIKQRFADLSLETGEHSTELLEHYLALIQEIPENRVENYEKISRIFALNGNENEAMRFKRFAEEAKNI